MNGTPPFRLSLLLLLHLWKHLSLSRAMAKARAHSSKRTTHHLLLAVSLSVCVLLPLLLPAAATAAVAVVEGVGEIKSALGAGRQWVTGKDEVNLVAEGDTARVGSVEEDEFAGGFGSLDSMLQWAIGNSDPEKLKEEAADVQKLSADELLKRRREIKVINAVSLHQYSDFC